MEDKPEVLTEPKLDYDAHDAARIQELLDALNESKDAAERVQIKRQLSDLIFRS